MQFLVQRAEFEQKASDLGIKVTDADVDKQLATIKSQYFGKSGKCDSTCEQKFQAELKKQNLTLDQVRDDVRASVVQNKIYEKVTAGVQVSDKDIADYYKKNKAQYVQPESRDVRHILVKKKALADQIYQQLSNGANFAALAKKYSTDPSSKDSGGKLTISKGRQVPEFDKVAFALKTTRARQARQDDLRLARDPGADADQAAERDEALRGEDGDQAAAPRQKKQEEMRKWVDDTSKELQVEDELQVGYAPPATTTGATTPPRSSLLSLADSLLELQELTRRLRRDCPWDREQTARTIVPHTVEEAYEVADAANGRPARQAARRARRPPVPGLFPRAAPRGAGAGRPRAGGARVHAKLVRRHPHVFGDVEARTAGRVRENWEQIKRRDEGREGIFHDVPESLPALLYARKLQRRAAAIDFEYPDTAGALADLDDELRELKEAHAEAGEPSPESEPDPHVFEEVGDVLFAAVNVARRAERRSGARVAVDGEALCR